VVKKKGSHVRTRSTAKRIEEKGTEKQAAYAPRTLQRKERDKKGDLRGKEDSKRIAKVKRDQWGKRSSLLWKKKKEEGKRETSQEDCGKSGCWKAKGEKNSELDIKETAERGGNFVRASSPIYKKNL